MHSPNVRDKEKSSETWKEIPLKAGSEVHALYSKARHLDRTERQFTILTLDCATFPLMCSFLFEVGIFAVCVIKSKIM